MVPALGRPAAEYNWPLVDRLCQLDATMPFFFFFFPQHSKIGAEVRTWTELFWKNLSFSCTKQLPLKSDFGG